MAASITQRIVDAIVLALQSAAPAEVNVVKGRKTPTGENALPLVQVYWYQETPTPVGNPRRPMILTRNLICELKLTVSGDDEAWDFHRQWIIAAMWTAGTLGGLVKNLSEGETVPYLEDSSVSGPLMAGAMRYAVEYNTLPGDITTGN